MTATVWKFPMAEPGRNRLSMPRGAMVRAVGNQNGGPNLWAEVDTEQPLEDRDFMVVGTGQPVGVGVYVGTAFCDPFVWHVYEVPRP